MLSVLEMWWSWEVVLMWLSHLRTRDSFASGETRVCGARYHIRTSASIFHTTYCVYSHDADDLPQNSPTPSSAPSAPPP